MTPETTTLSLLSLQYRTSDVAFAEANNQGFLAMNVWRIWWTAPARLAVAERPSVTELGKSGCIFTIRKSRSLLVRRHPLPLF